MVNRVGTDLDNERGPMGAIQPTAGGSITDDFFLHRVPFDRAAKALSDAIEVTNRSRPMAQLCGANGLLTGLDALQPIPFVIV